MILIAGDSLTAGHVGIGFTSYLKHPNHRPAGRRGLETRKDRPILARGLDGDTMLGITGRVLSYMKGRIAESMQGLIIEAGHNDLLIPYMAKLEPKWKEAMQDKLNGPSAPISDYSAFIDAYRRQLRKIIDAGHALGLPKNRIAITDLLFLGENLSTPLNADRITLNNGLRELAAELHFRIIPISKTADQILYKVEDTCKNGSKGGGKPDYLIPTPEATSEDARFISGSEERARLLSEKRGLALSVDGVHPNARCAKLLAKEIQPTLDLWLSGSSHIQH
ncbi:MAG: SGNH/GDSL hydrolase family protein [Spirochaetales bacterium]|nr:SGNH/GDSL hydrolase family protein [Spirochaetales bacterium]